MGQTLSEPITSKETSSYCDSRYRVGASCMQGWRINMEDAHVCLLSMPNDKSVAYFAVFDGHGGVKVAQYAGNHLHKVIAAQPEYAAGEFPEAIRKGFLAIDQEMLARNELREEMVGATAVVCLIRDGRIYCGNAGDSRAVACVGGKVQALSYDHKPTLETERRRIEAAGGWIDWNRVNGNLALSRALGDFMFKKNPQKSAEEQIVTANPDVVTKELTPEHEFIIIACDGIWDVVTNEEAVMFVRTRIAKGEEPEHICEALMMHCLSPTSGNANGTGLDNMSVVLVCFLHDGDYSDLQKRCATHATRSLSIGRAGDALL